MIAIKNVKKMEKFFKMNLQFSYRDISNIIVKLLLLLSSFGYGKSWNCNRKH